jgi:hypothetical protein
MSIEEYCGRRRLAGRESAEAVETGNPMPKKHFPAGKTTAQLDVGANIRSILIQRNTLTIY